MQSIDAYICADILYFVYSNVTFDNVMDDGDTLLFCVVINCQSNSDCDLLKLQQQVNLF